jgi:hypothetical protein
LEQLKLPLPFNRSESGAGLMLNVSTNIAHAASPGALPTYLQTVVIRIYEPCQNVFCLAMIPVSNQEKLFFLIAVQGSIISIIVSLNWSVDN